MELFDLDNLKQEKPNRMLRIFHFNRLRTFAKLLRTILELCAGIALLSCAVYRLPSAVKISGEFLRRLVGIISSPLFVFLLGNTIVAALLIAKSRHATSDDDLVITTTENETLTNIPKPLPEERDNPLPSHVTEEKVIFQDKEIILSQVTCQDSEINKTDETTLYCSSDSDSDSEKKYLERKKNNYDYEAEEELSDEEFQRAVDEFIAKHLRFRREESLAIVLQNYSINSLAEIY